jgi:hypothetical protein
VGRIDEIRNLKAVNNGRKTLIISNKYGKIKNFALAETLWCNHINGLHYKRN